MCCLRLPLHCVHLQSKLCTGFVRVAVCPSLTMEGVNFILRNYLAGGKVLPFLEVVDKPDVMCYSEELYNTYTDVLPTCVGDVVYLSSSFILPLLADDYSLNLVVPSKKQNSDKSESSGVTVSDTDTLKCSVSREKIIAAQILLLILLSLLTWLRTRKLPILLTMTY